MLLDTKDNAVVSKWWDSGMEALEQWRLFREIEPTPPQPTDRNAVIEEFSEWFRNNAPAGTVIGDPDWWIPRILRALKTNAKFNGGL